MKKYDYFCTQNKRAVEKLNITLMLSIPLSWWSEYGFGYYIFGDWQFLKWLVVLTSLDTILGFIKHWLTKDVSSKAFGMIGKKLIVYMSVMILANVVSHYTVGGEQQDVLKWFGTFCCTALMVRESISIIENVEAIYPGFFPKSIIRRLKDFDSYTGKRKEEHDEI